MFLKECALLSLNINVTMLKKRILALLIFLIVVLILFLFEAIHQSKRLHRDPRVLMDKYYQLKSSHPAAANKALLIVLKQDGYYLPALKESSQWYLHENNLQQARPLLKRLHVLLPENNLYTFQLGYLYYQQGKWRNATALFSHMTQDVTGRFVVPAQQALNAMASYLPYYANYSNYSSKRSLDHSLRPSYYPSHAPVILGTPPVILSAAKDLRLRREILRSTQDEVGVGTLKQKGYTAIAQGNRIMAIDYFTKAYAQTHEPSLAMQLGYLYDGLNDKPNAYTYFQQATASHDPVMKFNAQNALTNLAGTQTKALPAPYFGEVFFNPFTQTRFGLTVRPLFARAGVEQANRLKTKEYVFFRRTDDNRSENLGQISQIYEDNVEITGMGVQVTPFPSFQPLIGFFEAGAAYDLVFRDRDRWRSDFRGGFMYYQDFGKRPAYYDKLTAGLRYYSDWYGDATYFSRYNNNVIGGIRTRQGIRLLQYHSSMINLYMVGRVLGDIQRVFYNNYAEAGPGIAFVPSNRFNVQLRFEHVKGVYLPASSIPPNPYNKHYTNNFLQLLFYVKI